MQIGVPAETSGGMDKTMMVFGDAKKIVEDMMKSVE